MDETRKRTVELPPEIDETIDAAVAAGEYADADAAVSDALRDWKERRENWGYTIAELRAEVQKGDESGLAEDGETFLDGLRDRYERRGRTLPDPE